MDTTKLIVEYLVAGSLIVISTLFSISSWFPNDIRSLLNSSSLQQPILTNSVILATVFVALAYGVGIVSEYIGEQTFEWLFDRIKRRRMSKYVSDNEVALYDDPILGSFANQSSEERDLDSLAACVGKMRFYVMNHSALLYADIAAQISRFRLIRVLFLAEAIVILAIIGQLRFGFSPFLIVMFGLVFFIAYANFLAIRSRFNRYCRAIERSYTVLMIGQIK
jgi:hypothetical protein